MKGCMIENSEPVPPPCLSQKNVKTAAKKKTETTTKTEQEVEPEAKPKPSNKNHNFIAGLKIKLQTLAPSQIKIYDLPISLVSAVKYFFYSLLLKEKDRRKRNKKLKYFVVVEYIKFYKKIKSKEKKLKEKLNKLKQKLR